MSLGLSERLDHCARTSPRRPVMLTKRFVVNDQAVSGKNDTVSFANANGALTITDHGEADRNVNYQSASWFDPGKPVAVRFIHLGGESSEVSGCCRYIIRLWSEKWNIVSAFSRALDHSRVIRESRPFP